MHNNPQRILVNTSSAYGGFVSANSRPSAARTVALSVPTRGLRPLERWLCQCQLAAFGRSNGGFVSANSRPSAARTVALSVGPRGAPRRSDPQTTQW
ncbi:hypothetical protein Ddc_18859 [Ditylenchus destructor]|nr:hypothetical protein Ddc_18859 [Ditylenchus destructor]